MTHCGKSCRTSGGGQGAPGRIGFKVVRLRGEVRMRAMALLTPLLVASIARAAGGAASGYDDRVVIDRATKAARSAGACWQNPDKATADVRKALASHLNELRTVVRAVGVVLRSRDAAGDIVAHRRAMKTSIGTFLARVDVYGRTCHLQAAAQRKLNSIKRSKPPKPS